MKHSKGAILISVILILMMVGLDQWTKYSIMEGMQVNESQEIIPHLFYLTYVQNTGASFSMLQGAGVVFFTAVTLIALGFIVYYYFQTHDFRIHLCLALIFAGAIGNLIDRLWLGYVRDFFSVYIFGWPFPVFNVADICISMGFILLVLTYLYDEYKGKRHGKTKVSGQ